jgi:hypothetical protein
LNSQIFTHFFFAAKATKFNLTFKFNAVKILIIQANFSDLSSHAPKKAIIYQTFLLSGSADRINQNHSANGVKPSSFDI